MRHFTFEGWALQKERMKWRQVPYYTGLFQHNIYFQLNNMLTFKNPHRSPLLTLKKGTGDNVMQQSDLLAFQFNAAKKCGL